MTLEIVEHSPGVEYCDECAIKDWANGSIKARPYFSTLCMSLICRKRERADGKHVHWKLVEGSI